VNTSTGVDGRFTVTAPFAPTHVLLWVGDKWARTPRLPQAIGKGELVLRVPITPHRTVTGAIVDGKGVPVPLATLTATEDPTINTRADEAGHFSLEAPEPPPPTFRVRRMGFRPVIVSLEQLTQVTLPTRRPMVSVTVIDDRTSQPFNGLVQITAFHDGERLSFCTAGDPVMTHEAAVGECRLDVEPGEVELQLEGGGNTALTVTGPTQVTLHFTPPTPDVTGCAAQPSLEHARAQRSQLK
jgi:hypothetical protein